MPIEGYLEESLKVASALKEFELAAKGKASTARRSSASASTS